MNDAYKQMIGSWIDAIGTMISGFSELRELAGLDEINNQLSVIGEALQAIGPAIAGSVQTTDSLDFAGNWINSAGAAASSVAAYLQGIENREEYIQLEVLGDSLQSLGGFASAVANYRTGEYQEAKGDALQGLGAGLEAIGSSYELRGREYIGQIFSTIGELLQAFGANYNARIMTDKYFHHLIF